jgi:hypothetical protein
MKMTIQKPDFLNLLAMNSSLRLEIGQIWDILIEKPGFSTGWQQLGVVNAL